MIDIIGYIGCFFLFCSFFPQTIAVIKTKKFDGISYQQTYPNYSSIFVKNSKGLRHPMWWWTKNNRLDEINIPSKTVSVKNLKLIESEYVNTLNIIDNITVTIIVPDPE